MLKRLVFIFILAISITANGQDIYYKTYNWETNPSYTVTNPNAELVSLKEKVITEFVLEGEYFLEYYLEHKVLYLNSDDAIERYNRVYLPFSQSTRLEAAKARVIKKNGEIIELPEDKILEAEDEETGRKYKYFAFEGIEKGSIIEYYSIEKRNPRYNGIELTFQEEHEVQTVEFDLYSPGNLIFDFKSYNGLASVEKVETIPGTKNHWKLRTGNIRALDKEPSSAFDASKASVVYKMSKNLGNGFIFTSYNKLANDFYIPLFYGKNTPELETAIDGFSKDMGITAEMDEESKLRKIDNYIKGNIFITKIQDPAYSDLAKVISDKAANDNGVTKLYIALLRKHKIAHELVVTSDRLKIKFDPEFESYNFLTEYLIYFPGTKKYVAPTEQNSRYGFPSGYWMDNYGLFVKAVEIEGVYQSVTSIRYIEPLTNDQSLDVMLVDVSFDPEDLTVTNIKLDESMYGYNAQVIQPFINLIQKERINEIIEQLGKLVAYDEDAEFKDHEIVDDNPEMFGIKPMQVRYNMTSEAFVNKAGRKYLFKLGQMIGGQIEMYQEKKRVLPYEEQFQRTYDRVITVNIPEGYKVANLDDINIKNEYTKNGKTLFKFHSYYTLDGNKLTVKADEFYTQNIIAPELYEEYRTVINSAADFNKITLVIEPK